MKRFSIIVVLILVCCQRVHAADAVDPAIKTAESARKQLDTRLSFLTNATMSKQMTELYKAYADAGDDAHKYIFDDAKYAVPAKAATGWTPGKDKQPGQDEMERLVSTSIVKSNQWTGAFCAAMNGAPETVGDKKPTTTVTGEKSAAPPPDGKKASAAAAPAIPHYGFLSAQSTAEQFLTAFAGDYEKYLKARAALEGKKLTDTPLSENKPVIQAIGELALNHFADARDISKKLSGLELSVFQQLSYYKVQMWNKENLSGHSAAEADGVHLLNMYRITLNLTPMALNPKLHEMAHDYSNEMDKNKFFGHVHPSDASRKTMSDRAKRVNYAEIAGENITGIEPVGSIWMWRNDAGHHRNLLGAKATEIGLGNVKASVLNVGGGSESAVVALFVAPKSVAEKK